MLGADSTSFCAPNHNETGSSSEHHPSHGKYHQSRPAFAAPNMVEPEDTAAAATSSASSSSHIASTNKGGDGSDSATEQYKEGISSTNGSSRRKRARVGTKITRNRKITSCLPCRERKQKCDRTHPICQKCIDDGRKCIYIGNETSNDLHNAGNNADEKRIKSSEEDDEPDETVSQSHMNGSAAGNGTDAALTAFLKKRREVIAATWTAGRNRSLDFEARVRAARAAAVAEVLFAENAASDLKVYGKLKLPTRSEAQLLLQYYSEDVQVFTNILLVDLNRARIGDFLDWWHSKPLTLPAEADAPLAPLVLCVLALCLQARRTRDAIAKAERGDKSNIPQDGHCLSVIPSVSPERYLLETAGRCINALQIACPSSWASAYSAPLDIVRAETLRGIWHLGECHLQFASSNLSVALRLASAAGLHRDPKHWGERSMSEFEAQARRGLWWNIAYVEVFHSHRTGQPSSISADAADTELPLGFLAVAAQFKAAGFPQSAVSQLSFDCFVARFYLTKLFLDHGASVFGLRRKPAQVVRDLEAIYDQWERSLPDHLTSRMNNISAALISPGPDTEVDEPVWQTLLLQISRLQGRISVHRPYSDLASGLAVSRDASRRSLEKCLDAAAQLITLCLRAMTRKPGPPFLLLNIISYHTFNAGCLVAIHLVSGSNFAALCSAAHRDSLVALDSLADKRALHNVSEQAERYAAAIREIAASPGKFQQKPSDGSHPDYRNRSPLAGRRPNEDSQRTAPPTSNRPNPSLPLRVGRTSPSMEHSSLPAQMMTGPSIDQSTGLPRLPDWPVNNAGAASDYSRSDAASSPIQQGPSPNLHAGTPNSALHGNASASNLAPDHTTAGSSSEASAEDFFTKNRPATSFVDRPLPGSNSLHFGSLGTLLTEDISSYLSPFTNPDGRPSSGGQSGDALYFASSPFDAREALDANAMWQPGGGHLPPPGSGHSPSHLNHSGSAPASWHPAPIDPLRLSPSHHGPRQPPVFDSMAPYAASGPGGVESMVPSGNWDRPGLGRSRREGDTSTPPSMRGMAPELHHRSMATHSRYPSSSHAPISGHTLTPDGAYRVRPHTVGGGSLPPLGPPLLPPASHHHHQQHHHHQPTSSQHQQPPHHYQSQHTSAPHHASAHPSMDSMKHANNLPSMPEADPARMDATSGLGQVDWNAWENFITKVLQGG
ncbi:unnamed protein product [Sympodiomycopsis kandeliae]